jgi:pilus assembly protein CpaB
MNPKRITTALSLALFVSVLCTWLVARKMQAPAVVQRALPDLRYAASSRQLQAGELLKPENIELVAWPAAHPVDGAYATTAEIVGRVVLFPLSKGQPILDRDLSAIGSGIGLAGKIPDGMRAIALRSDEVVGVAGFLVPGSHLDVLVTYHSDTSPEPVTATVLQDAVVIAAGHQIEPDPEGKPSAVTVVTLLLSPEESERAVLASTQGTIHFVLRNGGDTSRTHDGPMQLSRLSGEAAPVAGPAARTAPRRTAPVNHDATIEVVLGEWPQTDWQQHDWQQQDKKQSESKHANSQSAPNTPIAPSTQLAARPDGGPRP